MCELSCWPWSILGLDMIWTNEAKNVYFAEQNSQKSPCLFHNYHTWLLKQCRAYCVAMENPWYLRCTPYIGSIHERRVVCSNPAC
jgi:hypothetical protein